MPTNLAKLARAEARNFAENGKRLGTMADMLSDFESLYERMYPLLKIQGAFPLAPSDFDSSDELFALVCILMEFGMCRILLVKSTLAVMRGYQGDGFINIRRAVEACAFAVRMNKHNELCRIWAKCVTDRDGDDTNYRAYRKAFNSRDVFPGETHADYDPLLTHLKKLFDFCSKTNHGSVFGMEGYFTFREDHDKIWEISFHDLRPDCLIAVFLGILKAHLRILQLFGRILEPHTTDLSVWERKYLDVEGKLQRHVEKWTPQINAWHAARMQSSKS